MSKGDKSYEKIGKINEFTFNTVQAVFNVFTTRDNRGKKSQGENLKLETLFTEFYDLHYKNLMVNEPISRQNLNQVLAYLSKDVVTKVENNIKFNFEKLLRRYIIVILIFKWTN